MKSPIGKGLSVMPANEDVRGTPRCKDTACRVRTEQEANAEFAGMSTVSHDSCRPTVQLTQV